MQQTPGASVAGTRFTPVQLMSVTTNVVREDAGMSFRTSRAATLSALDDMSVLLAACRVIVLSCFSVPAGALVQLPMGTQVAACNSILKYTRAPAQRHVLERLSGASDSPAS